MELIRVRSFEEKDGKLTPVISLKEAAESLGIGMRGLLHIRKRESMPPLRVDVNNHKAKYFYLSEFEGWKATRKRGKHVQS